MNPILSCSDSTYLILNAKMGKYAGDQLFHAISRDKDPITVYFIYFSHHKIEATHVLNGLPCILSE